MDILKGKFYAPFERNLFEQKPQIIKAYSAEDYTELPDPVRDPIVVNNIAYQEFDYTYDGDSIDFDDSQDDNLEKK